MIYKIFNIVGNFKKKCGHHDEKLELKQLFLRVYLSVYYVLYCWNKDTPRVYP